MDKLVLSNGVEIPQLGFGTFKITDLEECERCVLDALKAGYRLIDTAQAYFNEEAVGAAIIKSGIPREEIFVTTKLSFRNFEDPEKAMEESFMKLQLDYIDLVLIHWPYGNYYNGWRCLEKYYKAGKIRAIGVSNFDPGRYIDLVNFNTVVPHVNQIEANVLCQRHSDNEWMKQYECVIEAYAPLGQGKRDEVLNNETIVRIAKKHNKTSAQVAIKFLLQLGYVVIPKSSHTERIKENADVYDFVLDEQDMADLKAIDQNKPIGGRAEDPDRAALLTGPSHNTFGRNK